jgi:hypothetical protein
MKDSSPPSLLFVPLFRTWFSSGALLDIPPGESSSSLAGNPACIKLGNVALDNPTEA